MRLRYAIVFVSDMERSVLFYRDVLGLPLKFESPGWTEFSTGGTTLALHATERSMAENESGQELPAGQCRPGLGVPDLDAFHRRMVERGVACVREPQDVFGTRVAQYLDPDGMAISIGEDGPSG